MTDTIRTGAAGQRCYSQVPVTVSSNGEGNQRFWQLGKGGSSAHPMSRKAAHLPPKLGISLRSADYQLSLLLLADDLNLDKGSYPRAGSDP